MENEFINVMRSFMICFMFIIHWADCNGLYDSVWNTFYCSKFINNMVVVLFCFVNGVACKLITFSKCDIKLVPGAFNNCSISIRTGRIYFWQSNNVCASNRRVHHKIANQSISIESFMQKIASAFWESVTWKEWLKKVSGEAIVALVITLLVEDPLVNALLIWHLLDRDNQRS